MDAKRLTQKLVKMEKMCLLFSLFALLFVTMCAGHAGHYHVNSVMHVERLIYLERELIEFCDFVLHEEEEMHDNRARDVHNFTEIYSFLNVTRVLADKNQELTSGLSENPLALYHTKKRMMEQWSSVLEDIREESDIITSFSIAEQGFQRLQSLLEHEANIDEAIKDILRLKKIYNIPTQSIVNGFWDIGHAPPFDTDDLQRFITIAREMEDLELSLEFLEIGRNMKRQEKEEIQFMSDLANNYLTLDYLEKAQDTYAEILLKEPGNRIARGNLQLLQRRLKEKSSNSEVEELEEEENQDSLFANDPKRSLEKVGKFCRGEVQKSKSELDKLNCYDKILPNTNTTVRVEELNLYPRLVMIHDLYDDWQMEYLKKHGAKKVWDRLIEPNLKDPCKALIGNYHGAMSYIDDKDPFMDGFISRLENVTYHKITDYRKDKDILSWMAVANLGAGGKPDPIVFENHMMHTVYHSLRIAHYLTFLNKPTSGGAIVFPDLKVKVDPKPGASLFWQFRTPKGPVHPKFRRYIECPVVYGTQWVAKSTVEHYNKISSIRF